MEIASDVTMMGGLGFPFPHAMHHHMARMHPGHMQVAHPSHHMHHGMRRHHGMHGADDVQIMGADDVQIMGADEYVTMMGADDLGAFDAIKASFQTHKKAWIIGGIAAALGVGYVLMKRS